MAVRCLLHAAALDDRGPDDLYRWSLSPAAAKEAVEILVNSPRAALAWDKALDAIVSAERRQRDSVWAMVANAFAALADPGVLDAVSPGPDETFDPAVFLRQHGTLYLLGTASGASATAGLVAALIEDVVDVARRLAARSRRRPSRPTARSHLGRGGQLSASQPGCAHVRRGRDGDLHRGRAPITRPGPTPLGP